MRQMNECNSKNVSDLLANTKTAALFIEHGLDLFVELGLTVRKTQNFKF